MRHHTRGFPPRAGGLSRRGHAGLDGDRLGGWDVVWGSISTDAPGGCLSARTRARPSREWCATAHPLRRCGGHPAPGACRAHGFCPASPFRKFPIRHRAVPGLCHAVCQIPEKTGSLAPKRSVNTTGSVKPAFLKNLWPSGCVGSSPTPGTSDYARTFRLPVGLLSRAGGCGTLTHRVPGGTPLWVDLRWAVGPSSIVSGAGWYPAPPARVPRSDQTSRAVPPRRAQR